MLVPTEYNPLALIPDEIKDKYRADPPVEWLDAEMQRRREQFENYKPPKHLTLSTFFKMCPKAQSALLLGWLPDPETWNEENQRKAAHGDWVHKQIGRALVEAGIFPESALEVSFPDIAIPGRLDILHDGFYIELKSYETKNEYYLANNVRYDYDIQTLMAHAQLGLKRAYVVAVKRDADIFDAKVWQCIPTEGQVKYWKAHVESIYSAVGKNELAPAQPRQSACRFCKIKSRCHERVG